MRRRLTAMVFLVLAILLGASLASGATANDAACRKATVSGSVSHAELLAYDACRFDKLDAQIAALQRPGTTPPAPSPTVTSGGSASATAGPTTTAPASPAPVATDLALPRAAWAGGPDYYKPFAKAAGFTNPKVFPIGIFYNNYENDAQLAWDVDHGINYHVEGTNTGTHQGDLSAGMCFTSDELVGRDSDRDRVLATLSRDVAACTAAGRVPYTNHTGQVTSDFGSTNNEYFRKVINVGGAVSVDGYYYTDPSCDDPRRVDYQVGAPDRAHCARSASYGNFIRNLRARDDAPRQPVFGFVENGAPNDTNGKYITPAQMDGAIWSMITNGADGVIYFNNSFSGRCVSGAVLRDAQNHPDGCYQANAAQMRSTNAAVQSVAPVLNTQSFVWDFKASAPTDTMLKVKDGSAYVFASVGINGDAGPRGLTLPPGISGSSAEVVGENRTVPVSGGRLTDDFTSEYVHHLYKIRI